MKPSMAGARRNSFQIQHERIDSHQRGEGACMSPDAMQYRFRIRQNSMHEPMNTRRIKIFSFSEKKSFNFFRGDETDTT